jgi:hypothetical protein
MVKISIQCTHVQEEQLEDTKGVIGLVYGVKRHFQQHFSYIVAVSFIGGGNRITRRKPPTCLKSPTNFIT